MKCQNCPHSCNLQASALLCWLESFTCSHNVGMEIFMWSKTLTSNWRYIEHTFLRNYLHLRYTRGTTARTSRRTRHWPCTTLACACAHNWTKMRRLTSSNTTSLQHMISRKRGGTGLDDPERMQESCKINKNAHEACSLVSLPNRPAQKWFAKSTTFKSISGDRQP